MPTLLASKPATHTIKHTISMFNSGSKPNVCSINLDEKSSGRLDAYHALAERLLATGDWFVGSNQATPTFTATGFSYDLVLLRHFFKDGKLTEFRITLLLDTIHQDIEYLGVFSSDSMLNKRLSLDDAVTDIEALIAKIDSMYKDFAVSEDGQCWDIKLLEEIPFDAEVITQQLGDANYKGERDPCRRNDNLRISHFEQGLRMVICVTKGNKEYMHSISTNNYLKAVFYTRLDEINEMLDTMA